MPSGLLRQRVRLVESFIINLTGIWTFPDKKLCAAVGIKHTVSLQLDLEGAALDDALLESLLASVTAVQLHECWVFSSDMTS